MSKKITPVILAGGGGRRLWPLSKPSYPKQFHSFDGQHSLFQHTLMRVRPSARFANPLIITNARYGDLIEKEMKAINIEPAGVILEPTGRNTAPAILLAIFYADKHDLGPQLLVLPSDHVIEDEKELHRAIDVAHRHARVGFISTFGVKPSHPATGFGYIKAGPEISQADTTALNVEEFVEKPDLEHARMFIKSNRYFWNSGMFQFHMDTMADEMVHLCCGMFATVKGAFEMGTNDGLTFTPDSKLFRLLQNISIDYAVMERTDLVMVVPFHSTWSDVGSWSAVWEVSDKDGQSNVKDGNVKVEQCNGCYVLSDRAKILTLGLEDIVVVSQGDHILVAHKNHVQDISNLTKALV